MEDIFNDTGKLIFCAITLAAITEFIIGFVFLQKANNFMANAARTIGAVKTCERRTGNKGAVYYMLDVVYKDGLGQEYDAKIASPEEKNKGDQVEVLYDQNHPEKAKSNNKLQIYILPIAIMVGIFPFGIMLLMLLHTGIAKLPF